MYKAIRNNIVISINDVEDFPHMIYDSIECDEKHTVDDYVQYNNEWILKSEKPEPSYEEQREKRALAFSNEADPLKYDYEEDSARYGATSIQAIESKTKWLNKKEEIRARYPYPEGAEE